MTGNTIHWIYILLILSALMQKGTAFAEERPDVQSLPLPARLALAKINPMLEHKEYQRAAETLMAFQAQEKPASDSARTDATGAHHPEIYFALGNCYLLQERYAPAAEAFRQALARDPFHTSAWLNLAKAHYELNRYAEAGRCFAKGYETAGQKNPEHLYYSAAAYLMAGESIRSIEAFEQLLALHATEVKPEWKENLVHALLAADQPRKALQHIRELAHIYKGDKQIQWQEILLYQYVQLGMPAESLALAQALTQQAPGEPKWWKSLVHIHLNSGRHEEALAALTIYAYLSPLSLDENKLLADLHLQLGVPIKAAVGYEACLKEKSDGQLLHRLALAYRQLGRPETALERLDACGQNQNDPELMMLKGELHYLLKQYDKAVEVYRRTALSKCPQSGQAWLMAGYAALQAHDFSASREAFTKAVGYAREKNAAAAALQQLPPASVQ